MIAIEYVILIGSFLIILSIGVARLSENLGVPVLLLFLGIGMLAGSEGPGGIYFDDAALAQAIGVMALIFILFAGGLDTRWPEVKPTVWQATSLATLGVLLTAVLVGLFAFFVLKVSLISGLLLGAIVSSTDAAAVFSVLRSRNISLQGQLKPLLELESGSNDPMAVFLTVGILQLMTIPGTSLRSIAVLFVVQMGLGIVFGLGLGKLMVLMFNHMKSAYEGFYPVFAMAAASFIYGSTAAFGGSGFLAVYIAGLIAGNSEFIHKKRMLRFFDGFAWLSQITMFLTLGLLVFPSRIIPVMGAGIACSFFLMLIARPVGVLISLLFAQLQWREKILVSWVGLRGAVPIVLATFPLLAGIPEAESIFHVVFFIVLTSALLQAWSISTVARLLGLQAPFERKQRYPIEYAPVEGDDTSLEDLVIPFNAAVAGRPLVELGLPRDALIVLVSRNGIFFVPGGGTVLEEGDIVQVLVSGKALPEVREILLSLKEEEPE